MSLCFSSAKCKLEIKGINRLLLPLHLTHTSSSRKTIVKISQHLIIFICVLRDTVSYQPSLRDSLNLPLLFHHQTTIIVLSMQLCCILKSSAWLSKLKVYYLHFTYMILKKIQCHKNPSKGRDPK